MPLCLQKFDHDDVFRLVPLCHHGLEIFLLMGLLDHSRGTDYNSFNFKNFIFPYKNVVEGRQIRKHCFLGMFCTGGQTRKHWFLKVDKPGNIVSKFSFLNVDKPGNIVSQKWANQETLFPKSRKTRKHCFLKVNKPSNIAS